MPGSAINILAINATPADEAGLVGHLRDAGITAHSRCARQETGLIDALDQGGQDIALFFCGESHIALARAMALCSNYQPELPFILLYDEETTAILPTAMKQGVRDLVSKADLDRLQLVIMREYGDLCVRRQLERLRHRLWETEHRCSALIEASRDAIAYIHEGIHTQANPAYLGLFGFSRMDELGGMPVMDLVSSEEQARFKAFLRALDTRGDNLSFDVSCRHRDGHSFPACLECSSAYIKGEPCLQIIVRQPHQAPQQQPERDALTGLHSRTFFLQRLEQHLRQTQATGAVGTVLYIVVDTFQHIRNALGPAAAEAVVQETARLLEPLSAEQDCLARCGDHAFTLLNPHADEAAINTLAQRLCSTISGHRFASVPAPLTVTCSVGIAPASKATNAQDLIDQAYVASEVARAIMGGNQCATYNDAAQPATQAAETGQQCGSATIGTLLTEALEKKSLGLRFQPIVSLRGDAYESYEVMVELMGPSGESMLLEHFSRELAAHPQLAALDRWVIQQAIAQFAQQRQRGRKINIFIPLSAASLKDEGLLLWICDCLREAQAKGNCATFQITAADLHAHQQEAKRLIEGLKKIKCLIAITEFSEPTLAGTLLEQLGVDYVKLSASWMENLAASEQQQQRLHQLSNQLQSHDIKTIARGVEDADSLTLLWSAGINHVQGYFLREPFTRFDE